MLTADTSHTLCQVTTPKSTIVITSQTVVFLQCVSSVTSAGIFKTGITTCETSVTSEGIFKTGIHTCETSVTSDGILKTGVHM